MASSVPDPPVKVSVYSSVGGQLEMVLLPKAKVDKRVLIPSSISEHSYTLQPLDTFDVLSRANRKKEINVS